MSCRSSESVPLSLTLATCVRQDLPGRVVARCTDDSTARMCGGTAKVEVTDRRSIIGISGGGTQEKQTSRRHCALENVPTGQRESPFDIEWRERLAIDDGVLDVRRV